VLAALTVIAIAIFLAVSAFTAVLLCVVDLSWFLTASASARIESAAQALIFSAIGAIIWILLRVVNFGRFEPLPSEPEKVEARLNVDLKSLLSGLKSLQINGFRLPFKFPTFQFGCSARQI
jgi:hypothetical protein